MIFTTLGFWIFFIVTYLVFSLIYKKKRLRNTWLFLVSLFFYYKSGGYFFILLCSTVVVDYTLGLAIAASQSKLKKKLFVTLSVVTNLGVLSYFKYTYFFTDILNQALGLNLKVINYFALWTNSLSGSQFDITTIILPVGISFYTFQSLSYTIDVYRGKMQPVKNIIDFGFFVTFFPQLVAGPIVRAAEFIPQVYEDFKLTFKEYGFALFLIINGLIKKMVISDYISINFVDRVFDNPAAYSGFENLMSVYGYAIQIYCDFSGYTDIAIGIGLLLGFRLPLNFNSPYIAENITDFWRRWHISLSTWLRDYLYIPLGGNRKGKLRTYINLLITMLLGGLWHGAAWRFIIWGGLHGIGLALNKAWLSIFPHKNTTKTRFRHFLNVFFTFHFVCFSWIFFRAADMNVVKTMLHQITTAFGTALIPEMLYSYRAVFSLIAIAFIIHWLPSGFKGNYRNWFVQIPNWAKVAVAIATIFVVYQFKTSGIQPFIYFQF